MMNLLLELLPLFFKRLPFRLEFLPLGRELRLEVLLHLGFEIFVDLSGKRLGKLDRLTAIRTSNCLIHNFLHWGFVNRQQRNGRGGGKSETVLSIESRIVRTCFE